MYEIVKAVFIDNSKNKTRLDRFLRKNIFSVTRQRSSLAYALGNMSQVENRGKKMEKKGGRRDGQSDYDPVTHQPPHILYSLTILMTPVLCSAGNPIKLFRKVSYALSTSEQL